MIASLYAHCYHPCVGLVVYLLYRSRARCLCGRRDRQFLLRDHFQLADATDWAVQYHIGVQLHFSLWKRSVTLVPFLIMWNKSHILLSRVVGPLVPFSHQKDTLKQACTSFGSTPEQIRTAKTTSTQAKDPDPLPWNRYVTPSKLRWKLPELVQQYRCLLRCSLDSMMRQSST